MNQYRCETCKHFQTSDKGMSPDCDILNHWLTEGDRKTIDCVGCASHSDFQSERDKLEELWQFSIDNGVDVRDDLIGFRGDGGFLLLKILKKMAELRQAEP